MGKFLFHLSQAQCVSISWDLVRFSQGRECLPRSEIVSRCGRQCIRRRITVEKNQDGQHIHEEGIADITGGHIDLYCRSCELNVIKT